MAGINDCFRALTICGKCLGCNKLEDETFRGTNNCPNFRTAEKPEPYDSKKHDNWRPPK